MTETTLPIVGMRCGRCVKTIEEALLRLPGVASAAVHLDENNAQVQFDSGRVSLDQLTKAISEAGFSVADVEESSTADGQPASSDGQPATANSDRRNAGLAKPEASAIQELSLDVEGMHCASCVGRVESALTRLPGIAQASANLLTNQVSVQFTSEALSPELLIAEIERAGYHARLASEAADDSGDLRRVEELQRWRRRLTVSGVLLAAIIAVAHGSGLQGATLAVLLWALATPVQFFVGAPFLLGAWKRTRTFSADMDTLIALGTSVAYAAGTAALVRTIMVPETSVASASESGKYFMDAAMIITVITLGRWLEALAKGRASGAIRKLLDLTPPHATVLRAGEHVRVPVAELAID
ncbi:MAG: copper ion binding protein, partial [Planctomycetales bacterium]